MDGDSGEPESDDGAFTRLYLDGADVGLKAVKA